MRKVTYVQSDNKSIYIYKGLFLHISVLQTAERKKGGKTRECHFVRKKRVNVTFSELNTKQHFFDQQQKPALALNQHLT